jgi:hypothetical protein
MCAHSAAIVKKGVEKSYLTVFGGFQGGDQGPEVSKDLNILSLSTDMCAPMSWVKISTEGISGRFGHCSSTIKLSSCDAMLVFGGVNLDEDLCDLWIVC